MLKEILCTIDFSGSSQPALQWAVEMAKKMNCRLIVLYTYRLNKQSNTEVLQWKREQEQHAAEKFAQLENKYLINSGIPYEFRAEVGFISDRIEDHLRKHGTSFLVMDKEMITVSKDSFDEIVSHIDVPLMIIP